jgi:4'-phosphopantetheinyl transferase
LLGAYLDQSPQSVRFQVTEYGKPLLDPDLHFQFNVSHTEGLALLAFAEKRRIGIDVEKIRSQPDALKLARRFFSERERQQLENIAEQEMPAAFFRCWSRKEAYIKARGEGLSLPLHDFDVAVEIAPTQILLATRPDAGEVRHWLMSDVPAPPGYTAAVAVSIE